MVEFFEKLKSWQIGATIGTLFGWTLACYQLYDWNKLSKLTGQAYSSYFDTSGVQVLITLIVTPLFYFVLIGYLFSKFRCSTNKQQYIKFIITSILLGILTATVTVVILLNISKPY